MSLQSGLGLVPYSHCIPTIGQGVPPDGGVDGQEGFVPPLLDPLPPELLPEVPPELLPEPPLDPEPPPELLLLEPPEPPLEPEPPPEPELLPPSVPPSVPPENVAPPHAHIAAAAAAIQSFARMSRTSRPRDTARGIPAGKREVSRR
jgi:hypothetical protein